MPTDPDSIVEALQHATHGCDSRRNPLAACSCGVGVVRVAVESMVAENARLREERNYYRSLLEQLHRDTHDALSETEAKMIPEPFRYTETEYLNIAGERDEARGEVERLRTALETLRDYEKWGGARISHADNMKDIARSALKGDD